MSARTLLLLASLLLPLSALAQAEPHPVNLQSYLQTSGSIVPSGSFSKSLGNASNVWLALYTATIRDGNSANRMILVAGQGSTYISGVTSPTSLSTAHLFNTNGDWPSGSIIADWENNGTSAFHVTVDGHPFFNALDTSGAPGAATANTGAGQASVAASASSVVVTNSTVTTTSIIMPILQQVDATCTSILNAVPAAGSFTIHLNANCTGNTKVGWLAIN